MNVNSELISHMENPNTNKEKRQLIRKKLKSCMEANGYKQGRCSSYYRITDDIVVYFKPEHPSVMTYLWLCFYPLYMPPGDIRVFSFGDRISSLTDQYIWDLRDYESESSIDVWCKRITEINSTRVSSFVQRISTAHSIDRLVDDRDGCIDIDGFLHIGTEKVNELAMFTKLVLHQYDEAAKIAQQTQSAGANGRFKVTRRLSDHCKTIIDLATIRDAQYTDDTIGTWREANIARFLL
jgi:hypothetical protein